MHSRKDFTEALRPYVTEGEHLMVHTSYKALGGIEGGPNAVIDVLLDLLGADGTLLLPTFTLDAWAQNHYFDIRETPGLTGIIGELARQRPEFTRTRHPMYNFAVCGVEKQSYCNIDDHDSFGKNSVYAHFHRANGRILSLGVVDPDSTLSQAHYNEQWHGAQYRYVKRFSGIYVNEYGIPRLDTYSMFVRLTQRYRTRLNPATDRMIEQGAIKLISLFGEKSLWTYSQDYFDAHGEIVRTNPELCYEVV
jgi:aminoglycoside 3-N-acetyltransferase